MVATGRVPTLPWVDAHLKLLAEVSLAVERAEAAAGEGGFTGAREALDEAEAGLQACASGGPRWAAAERALVGRAAAPVRQRLDAVARGLPRPQRADRGRARARSRAGAGPGRGVGPPRALRDVRRAGPSAVGRRHDPPARAGRRQASNIARPVGKPRPRRKSRAGPSTAHGGTTVRAYSRRGDVLHSFVSRSATCPALLVSSRQRRCCSGRPLALAADTPPAFTSRPDRRGRRRRRRDADGRRRRGPASRRRQVKYHWRRCPATGGACQQIDGAATARRTS